MVHDAENTSTISEWLPASPPRYADQQIKPAELLDRVVDESLEVCRLGQIGAQRQHLTIDQIHDLHARNANDGRYMGELGLANLNATMRELEYMDNYTRAAYLRYPPPLLA